MFSLRKLLYAQQWSHVTIHLELPQCGLVWSSFVFVCAHILTFDFCPRPCSSTYRWARLATHRYRGTTLCVYHVLLCPPWPCYHRMCVSRQDTGLSPLAGTCRHVKGASTSERTDSFVWKRSRLETTIQKMGDNSSCDTVLFCRCSNRVFSAPPGANCTELLLYLLL